MQNEASVNESKYSEQFYARDIDGNDYQVEIELEDGPGAEDPEKLTVIVDGERRTIDVPKGGTDDHYKKAIEQGLKELGRFKLMEGKIPDMNEGKYPRFVQIKTMDDYNKFFVPSYGGDLLKKGYEFSDLENAWWEIAFEEEDAFQPKSRLKSMRQILNSEPSPKFIYTYSDRLLVEGPRSYINEMGMEPSEYGVKEDDLYESKAGEAAKKLAEAPRESNHKEHNHKEHTMNIKVKEMKRCEALSPKMQNRLKIKAYQDATLKLKGFKEAGYSFLDLWADGKCYPICIAAQGKTTKKEAVEAAKKMFSDFDDYVNVDSDFIPEGGPNGEDLWFPAYALKKTFIDLPEDEGQIILSEISDVLYKVLVSDKRGGRHESNEAISSKLQDRIKFKEFAAFLKKLPFFGQTIGETVETLRKEGLGYGVGGDTKKDQEDAAKDILSDFSDYVSWEIKKEEDEDEDQYYIQMTFKPALWKLELEDLKKVFSLLDDAFGPYC